ncbi:DUF257 family protein [Thermococcus sp. LS1]|uniref:DUF257 family protein n=1 Tax=Thermococcus sp. LS1 TaxID=1638259 RepID=UPI00143935F5|nr:DUF257 family protein [Thermococcus sp. LS1]
MSKNFEKTLFEYADMIRPGELVLVEYTSEDPVHLILQMILRYAKLKAVPIFIVDTLDGLHVMKTKLDLEDIDTSLIDDVFVVKVGGLINVGNVFKKIEEINEISILKRQYTELLQKICEKTEGNSTIRLVVGATELLQRLESDPVKREEFITGLIKPLVGHQNTIGVVFLNRKRITRPVLSEVEETATRVLRTRIENGKLLVRIVKSVYFDEYGAEVRVDPWDLREYLIAAGGD